MLEKYIGFIVVACLGTVLSAFSVEAADTKLAVMKAVPDARVQIVSPSQLIKVKEALLHRVDEGVFQLRIGRSIDLTDRKVLFNFREYYGKSETYRKMKNIRVYVNGDSQGMQPGDRINLKSHKMTAKYFEGNEECFVDFVDLIDPKGAPAVGTFRVHCE